MARKQTRRTFSVSRVAYEEVKRVAAAEGIAAAAWVERLIRREIPGMVAPQTAVVPLSQITGDSFDRGETCAAPQPRITRAELDAIAAARIAPPAGTSCANCIDAKATHRGRVDTSGQTYWLCDDCEMPDDNVEDARGRWKRRTA